MRAWTFIHVDGERSVVKARDEATARDAAMRLRWGPPEGALGRLVPPSGIVPCYSSSYQGRGLTLVG